MKAYYLKFLLIASAIALTIFAIWNDENRLKVSLTALVLFGAWGIWLAVDRNDPSESGRIDGYPPHGVRPGASPGRGGTSPVMQERPVNYGESKGGWRRR